MTPLNPHYRTADALGKRLCCNEKASFRQPSRQRRILRLPAARKATLRAYRSDWHDFEKWCDRHCLIMLPADARTVAAYLSSLATGRPMKLATIRRRLATNTAVKATMAGIARTIGSVHSKKTALTAALVAKVVKGDLCRYGRRAPRSRADTTPVFGRVAGVRAC
jgi:hypothetical protein